MTKLASPKPCDAPLLWDIDTVRQQLGNVHRGTVDRLVRKGRLQRVRIGTRSLITRESVLALIEACRVTS